MGCCFSCDEFENYDRHHNRRYSNHCHDQHNYPYDCNYASARSTQYIYPPYVYRENIPSAPPPPYPNSLY